MSEAPIARTVTIVNERGLHARAAAKLVQTAGRFQARVTVARGGEEVGAGSIMGLLMLAAGPGSDVAISATGADAAEAMAAIVKLIEAGFGEE